MASVTAVFLAAFYFWTTSVSGAGPAFGVVAATQPLSPIAVTTWFADSSSGRLELAVVWVGREQWYLDRRTRSGRTATSDEQFASSEAFGPVSLDFTFDRTTRTMSTGGEQLKLGENNVIFIENVDGDPLKRRFGTRFKIDAPVIGGRVTTALRTDSRLTGLLGCELKDRKPEAAGLMARLCGQLEPR